MIRKATAMAGIALLVQILSSPAFAGGWAVTTVDKMPALFEAGITYEIEYTILQHGKHPAEVESTSLTFVPSDGDRSVAFVAEEQGEPGVYVAQVTLPEAGDWSWNVSQDWFGVQELGVISVQPATGVATATTSGVVLLLLLVATLVALVLYVAQLVVLRRGRGPIAVADGVG